MLKENISQLKSQAKQLADHSKEKKDVRHELKS